METLSHVMIGRIISVMDPEMVQELVKDYAPLSRDKSMVTEIYEAVNALFPEMKEQERTEMFIAVVYRVFVPVSFLPAREIPGEDRRAQQKLPTGIRGIIAKCLDFKHQEEVNRLKHYVEPFIKNARYRAKMKLVTDAVGLTVPNTES
jgi:hypothetical protein